MLSNVIYLLMFFLKNLLLNLETLFGNIELRVGRKRSIRRRKCPLRAKRRPKSHLNSKWKKSSKLKEFFVSDRQQNWCYDLEGGQKPQCVFTGKIYVFLFLMDYNHFKVD